MAVLKKDLKRVSILMPADFLNQLNKHLKNFALTDRSSWMLEASREKMGKEKQMLSEMEDKEE